jgi:hypothetical protein
MRQASGRQPGRGCLHCGPVRFTISIDRTDPYLAVTAAGPAGLAELSGAAALVGELVRFNGHARVLADLGAVQPDLSFTDHLRFGNLVWSLLGRLERLAAVVPPGYLDAPAAKAARLAGVPLKTFLQREDARDWIEHAVAPLARVRHAG